MNQKGNIILSFGRRIDAQMATRSGPSVRLPGLLILVVTGRRFALLDADADVFGCGQFRLAVGFRDDVERQSGSVETVAVARLGAPLPLRPDCHLVFGRAIVQQGARFFLSISQFQVTASTFTYGTIN